MTHKKINLHNFGCDKIYVISDPENVKRRESFIKDWEYFDGFEYEFVDSVNYSKGHFSIDKLLRSGEMSGEWHDLELGKYGQPGLTENMIGIALAHKKCWELTQEGPGNKYLILEDDARPSNDLIDYIYDGSYKLLLEKLSKIYCDIFWIGRTSPRIAGKPVDDLIQVPHSHLGIGAHAYIVDNTYLLKLINNYKLNMPVDLYLEYVGPNMFNELTNVYSPYVSLINQKGHMISKWLNDDPTDPDYIFSTTSQVNTLVEEPLEHPWKYTSRLMREYCDDHVEVYTNYGYKWTRVNLKPARIV
jgi:GR25 family glycosyltransferase involved in LPS biosynthesis